MKRLVLGLTLLLLSGISQSQEPIPRPTVDSQKEKSHAAKSNKKTTRNPTGTDKNPLVVKSLEGEKTRERVEQERPEKEEHSTNEGRLVFWNVVLGAATVLMAGIAGGQLVMFFLQLGYMRDELDRARVEFFMAHKPRMLVRGVRIHYGDLNKPVGIRFVLVNEGESEAKIVGNINVNIKPSVYLPELMKNEPSTPPYGNKFAKSDKVSFLPQERHTVVVIDSEINETLLTFIQRGERNLFFFGLVIYQDRLGNQRPHGFYWKYNGPAEKFELVDNPEYNYG